MKVRSAKISDAEAIYALINFYAELDKMQLRSLADIYENLQAFTVAELDGGVDLTVWTLTEARGISDDGLTIVGYGNNPSGNTEVWMAAIPEPSALLLLGLGCVAVLRRRRA
jgi:hypothetical protein